MKSNHLANGNPFEIFVYFPRNLCSPVHRYKFELISSWNLSTISQVQRFTDVTSLLLFDTYFVGNTPSKHNSMPTTFVGVVWLAYKRITA